MRITAIATRKILPPKDNLFAVLREFLHRRPVPERSICVIASKIVSIGEGRCIKIDRSASKEMLIQKEAAHYLPRAEVPRERVMLTMKHNIMIPTAGIDESNGNGYYILWPRRPFASAKKIHQFLTKEFHRKELGVVIADSHTVPLRWGTMGIALAFWGFYPLRDYRGTPDIFGRKLKHSQSNIADALATAGVTVMGEGSEQTPLALINEIPFVRFGNFNFIKKNPLAVKRAEDIYGPLLNTITWRTGGESARQKKEKRRR